ncbi:hypothetical protein EMO92_08195 [Bifidobacterium reuteri]|uniref:Uncharacterized protein n=2 Tax=Bifidobacterium TaxID=1678 RepID=A0A5J5E754_9BIFI|nr:MULTISPECIES: hypothetical protein [Bifidobacterium]KAA8824877.1 hypothetical protein EMO92_08195 [Bifidobacterium reuteri]KAA8825358.1 hypothetical protein EMO89_11915 [Bifidobacterium tissieri]TPF91421.1 hypothetical protein BW10_00240 [Bifidobacterium sp. UTBIF-56]
MKPVDDLILAIAEWTITGLLGVIATVLWRQLKHMRQDAAERQQRNELETAALKRGMQMILRAYLVNLHHKWVAGRGYMPVEQKRLWSDMFNAYEALGENGIISALYEDVKEAHVAPDIGKEQQ